MLCDYSLPIFVLSLCNIFQDFEIKYNIPNSAHGEHERGPMMDILTRKEDS